VNWKCFNVVKDGGNGEVENRLKLSKSFSGKQVNFGLEMSMKETNYLISSQHLPFRINTLC
jgi:hypothetical protein